MSLCYLCVIRDTTAQISKQMERYKAWIKSTLELINGDDFFQFFCMAFDIISVFCHLFRIITPLVYSSVVYGDS